MLTNPTLIPIKTPPIMVIDKPINRGGRLSAYASRNSPENIIETNATATSLKGGKAMLMSARPAISQIEKTSTKESSRQISKSDFAFITPLSSVSIPGSLLWLFNPLNRLCPMHRLTVAGVQPQSFFIIQ